MIPGFLLYISGSFSQKCVDCKVPKDAQDDTDHPEQGFYTFARAFSRPVIFNYSPGSIKSVKNRNRDKKYVKNAPPAACMQPVGDHREVQMPLGGKVQNLEMHDQEESPDQSGDPLQEPAISPT